MDLLDRKLLTILQIDFPLTLKPFQSLARMLETDEKTVLDRTNNLKRHGIIRQISAIFDSASIGYQSTLIAFKVPAVKLAEAADLISANAGVSHNYERTGKYNLWFTLTLPASKDLRAEAEKLSQAANVVDWLFLPALRTFKIKFQLDLTGTRQNVSVPANLFPNRSTNRAVKVPQSFIRELQKDLPVVSRPYKRIAEALKITESGVVERIKKFTASGAIRRVAAVVRQKKAGFPANIMVAWAPKEDLKESLARCAVKQQKISHCYERPSSTKWPYSVYTMIHGKTMAECSKVIKTVSAQSGVKQFSVLPTVQEFKKVRVQYYS
jgi:DNA-binding Lrp family transcriptional regulator